MSVTTTEMLLLHQEAIKRLTNINEKLIKTNIEHNRCIRDLEERVRRLEELVSKNEEA